MSESREPLGRESRFNFISKFKGYFKSKIEVFIMGIITSIIASFMIYFGLELFKSHREPYITVIMSENYPDFRIPEEFLKGFYEAEKKIGPIKTKNGLEINIKYEDDLGSMVEAERIAEKIIKDENCILVVGNSNSTLSNKTIDVFLKHLDAPAMILPIATANEITVKTDVQGYNYVLRLPPTNEKQAEFIAKVSEKFTKDKSKNFYVAIYGDLENQFYSENLCRDIARNIRMMGGHVIIEELIGATNSIYTSNEVFNSKTPPEIIIFAGVIHNGLLLMDQIAYLGIQQTIIFSDGCMSQDILNNVGKLNNQAFLTSPVTFNEEEPEQIPTYISYGKDTYQLLKNLFKYLHKVNRESVRKFIHDCKDLLNFKGGFAGSYEFNKRGDNIAITYHLYEITGGKLKYFKIN